MKGDVGIIMKNETAVAAKGSKASVGMMLLQNKEGLSSVCWHFICTRQQK